jgi:GTP-binding protein HflX
MPAQIQPTLATFHAPTQRHALLLQLRTKGQAQDELAWAAQEFEALAHEIGCVPVCSLLLTRSLADTPERVGRGTLEVLQSTLHDLGPPHPCAATVLLVDGTLSPKQQRELEQTLALEVLDRTQLILQLFALRARSEEAKLTVELARARHLLPRLREERSKQGREGGGGRGARGNTQVALAKERCRARIATLERQLARAQGMAHTQRVRREPLRRVAIVGYTNAGKSSWLSALSGKDTLIADKPFASLATTVRTLQRKSAKQEPILICDTVGLVRALPHELVPSFQATLEEAREADLLLCVVDAADPRLHEQLQVVERTLEGLNRPSTPCWILLNKLDRLSVEEQRAVRRTFPTALHVSAHANEDVAFVRQRLASYFGVAV